MKTGKLSFGWNLALVILPLVTAVLCLGIGRMVLPPNQVLNALFGVDVPDLVYKTVWNIRLPRIVLAMLVGGGLAAAGCAFQSLFANPLATPDTLGVASGASFGASLAILMGCTMVGIQLTSLVAGGVAVLLTWLGGSKKGSGLNTIVLSGIMMGSLFNALVSLAKYIADAEDQLPAITFWLMGGLNSAGWKNIALGAPAILVSVLVLWLLRWRLNLLPLTEDEARASGVNMKVLRGVTILCATLITASCVSLCGQVGWVGLLIPHICRMKFGSNHLSLLPSSVSLGAAFMILVDTVARSATASEIPISILTAIIGAPFFIVLMRRSGGWRL